MATWNDRYFSIGAKEVAVAFLDVLSHLGFWPKHDELAARQPSWTDGKPNVGLFIVPGGDQVGEIETLVWNSWANDAANATQKECVEKYVACMKDAKSVAQSPAKGLIGALLSVKSDEDPRLGPGARENVFDLTRPELQKLREFLSHFA